MLSCTWLSSHCLLFRKLNLLLLPAPALPSLPLLLMFLFPLFSFTSSSVPSLFLSSHCSSSFSLPHLSPSSALFVVFNMSLLWSHNADLELRSSLPLPPKYCNSRCVCPSPISLSLIKTSLQVVLRALNAPSSLTKLSI